MQGIRSVHLAAKLRLDNFQQRRHLEIRRRLHELEKHLEKHVILKRELHFRHVHEERSTASKMSAVISGSVTLQALLSCMPQLKRF